MDTYMKPQERDDAFGRTLLTLRTRLGLTQSHTAEILGVSSRTITSWETGASYPNIKHLKHFIELVVHHHAFPSEHEREAIEQMWRQAHQRVLLDDIWMETLLSLHSRSSSALERNEDLFVDTSSASPRPLQTPEQKSLLTTKFFIPSPSHFLMMRSRLTDWLLHLSLERPFTLISAPAGFGKTSLLSSWFRLLPQGKQCIAWLSLEETDNDPVQFWRYVLSALQQQRPGSLADLLTVLQEHHRSAVSYVVTALLNELAGLEHPLLLVLDDYHLITEPTVHSALASFIDHLPPRVHLVMATRVDPPFSLSRWRVQGKLLELRAEHLRWTQEEMCLFLEKVMHLSLSPEQIQQVHKRTEGWIVGAQLLGLSLQGREMPENLLDMVSGSQHYILDFLIDEVLQRQEASVQTFLLHTSILERLSASLCDAVVQRQGSQHLLNFLERANLFVDPLDMQRHWYRYHALFAEALQYRLAQAGDEIVATLHRRASQWYEQQGQTNEAIMHALQARDWHRATNLIEPVARGQLWAWKNEVFLRRWIEQLPPEVTRSRPLLSIVYVLSLFRDASPELIGEWLRNAEEEITSMLSQLDSEQGEAESVQQSELHDLLGTVFVLQAFNAAVRGNGFQAVTLNQQALGYLSEQNLSTRSLLLSNQGMIHLAIGEAVVATQETLEAVRLSQAAGLTSFATPPLITGGIILLYRGHLHEAWEIFEQAIAMNKTERSIISPFVSRAYGYQADLLREWNRIENTDALLDRAVQMAEQVRDWFALEPIYVIRASLALAREDNDLAISSFEQAEQAEVQLKSPFMYVLQVLPRQVRFWIAQGKIAHAVRVVEELRQQDQQVTPLTLEQLEVARVRILLAQHEPEEALRILLSLLPGAIRQERFGHVIEMYLLQARAFGMVQQEQQALVALREALHLAEPEGYIRTFVDEGSQMKTLLTILRRQERHYGATPYLDILLDAFSLESEPIHKRQSPLQQQRLIHPLTEREVQILREMAQGATNQHIAERLVIAVTTVKRHISHILEKLEVENRTQAIVRARTLGLLSE